jgi:hypothetical protein
MPQLGPKKNDKYGLVVVACKDVREDADKALTGAAAKDSVFPMSDAIVIIVRSLD